MVVYQQVELRSYVLGCQYSDVRLFLLAVREEGSPIAKFGIWGFCVELRKGLRAE